MTPPPDSRKTYDVAVLGWWYAKNYGSITTYYGLNRAIESLGRSVLMVHEPLGYDGFRVRWPDDILSVEFARRAGYAWEEQRHYSELTELNDRARTFLVGSDQLWNPLIGRVNDDLFLDFVSEGNERIAYGTSFGNADRDRFSPAFVARNAPNLQKFAAVSVREEYGVDIARDVFGVRASQVVDPVFLLPADHYADLADRATIEPPDGEYMTVFLLDPDERKRDASIAVANRLGFEQILVVPNPDEGREPATELFGGDPRVTIMAEDRPENFLRAYRDASYVITDSYHGSAFSAIFEKPFSSIYNTTRGADRFTNLLSAMGFGETRRIRETDDADEIFHNPNVTRDVDFARARAYIEEGRARSLAWLADALDPDTDASAAEPAVPARALHREKLWNPDFLTDGDGWTISPGAEGTGLRVGLGRAVIGNQAWCDFREPLIRGMHYRLSITWTPTTRQPSVNLHVREPETGQFQVIGSVGTPRETRGERTDTVVFQASRDGLSQFMLGAVHFSGWRGGAHVRSIRVDEITPAEALTAAQRPRRRDIGTDAARVPRRGGGIADLSSYPIQSAIWPQPGITTETAAHVALKGAVGVSLHRGGADFEAGGQLDTGTYYNLFNLGKWRRNAGDLPLELQLTGTGRFLLTIHLARRNRPTVQLTSDVITLDGAFRKPFFPYLDDATDLIVSFTLVALGRGRLESFAWATTRAPRTLPDLTLAVTTFRREDAVEATAERFRRFRAQSELADHLRMVIVDNGRSAPIEDGDGVSVIPNENLGGSGGFARGLLAAQDAAATHVLFMDDDASIQMEAVSRTWWFLAYANDPSTAVAGAMIHDAERWRLGENGAHFDLGCKAHFVGFDLRHRDSVYHMEYETTAPAGDDFYGGWWYFAFPIAQVRHLPFPFFVRGDDVSFSLVNDFNTFTLPGVASVQESFVDKASPLTWYLDFRSHLIHHLSLPEKKRSWKELHSMTRSFHERTALRFHYDTLAAVNLAFEDVLRGPGFFDENADMAQRRADIKAMTKTEVWKPIRRVPEPDPEPVLPLGEKPYRASLNGHVLPLPGVRMVVESQDREDGSLVYGAREVTYLNVDRTKAYTVRRDRLRFLVQSLRLLKNALRLRLTYSRMLRRWRRGYDGMTSESYWGEKLRLTDGGPPRGNGMAQRDDSGDPGRSLGVMTGSRR